MTQLLFVAGVERDLKGSVHLPSGSINSSRLPLVFSELFTQLLTSVLYSQTEALC